MHCNSRPDWPKFSGQNGSDARADWFGYPGKVHGAIPDRLEVDFVKQVSTYQTFNDMKIASLLQKLW